MGHLDTRAALWCCCTEMRWSLTLLVDWDLPKHCFFSSCFRLWVFPGWLPVGAGPPLPESTVLAWPRHQPTSHLQDPLGVRLENGSGNPEHVFQDLGRAPVQGEARKHLMLFLNHLVDIVHSPAMGPEGWHPISAEGLV